MVQRPPLPPPPAQGLRGKFSRPSLTHFHKELDSATEPQKTDKQNALPFGHCSSTCSKYLAIPSLNAEPQSATFGRGSPYFDPEASLRSPQLAPAVPGGWGHASSCVEVCLSYLVPACSPSHLAPPCAAARPCRPDCAAARQHVVRLEEPARRGVDARLHRVVVGPLVGRGAGQVAVRSPTGSRGKDWVILGAAPADRDRLAGSHL